MSKAFTKDDVSDAPLILPRRAPLPAGMPNYVTARGLARLRLELAAVKQSSSLSSSSDGERAREGALQAARVAELEQRLAAAVLVESRLQAQGEVRFGATVSVENGAGRVRRYRIVGVDEANATEGAIAFVAPLARALLGKRLGEVATIQAPAGEEELVIVAIDYDDG